MQRGSPPSLSSGVFSKNGNNRPEGVLPFCAEGGNPAVRRECGGCAQQEINHVPAPMDLSFRHKVDIPARTNRASSVHISHPGNVRKVVHSAHPTVTIGELPRVTRWLSDRSLVIPGRAEGLCARRHTKPNRIKDSKSLRGLYPGDSSSLSPGPLLPATGPSSGMNCGTPGVGRMLVYPG